LYNPSDENLKKNIQEIDKSLDKIMTLRAVTFEWKDDLKPLAAAKGNQPEGAKEVIAPFPKGKQLGVIAQDVEKVFPELVITDENGDKAVNYTALTPVLLEAIKEQQKQIEALTRRLELLEKGIK
jgi:hypothetical protein